MTLIATTEVMENAATEVADDAATEITEHTDSSGAAEQRRRAENIVFFLSSASLRLCVESVASVPSVSEPSVSADSVRSAYADSVPPVH
jgi:hypothetical protein